MPIRITSLCITKPTVPVEAVNMLMNQTAGLLCIPGRDNIEFVARLKLMRFSTSSIRLSTGVTVEAREGKEECYK